MCTALLLNTLTPTAISTIQSSSPIRPSGTHALSGPNALAGELDGQRTAAQLHAKLLRRDRDQALEFVLWPWCG